MCRLDIRAALASLTDPTCCILMTGVQSFTSTTVMLRIIFFSARARFVYFAIPFNYRRERGIL